MPFENPACLGQSVGLEAATICTERERLAEEYRACVDRFRVAVSALKNLFGAEFDRAYETSGKQRIVLEKARIALDQHRVEHRCQSLQTDR
jgi:hypothetical protein